MADFQNILCNIFVKPFESLHFTHMVIVWFIIHCDSAEKQNLKNIYDCPKMYQPHCISHYIYIYMLNKYRANVIK